MLSVRGGACIAFGATLAVVLSEGFGWFLAVHVKGAYHWQGAGAAQFMIGLGFIPGFLMVCVLVRGGLVVFVNSLFLPCSQVILSGAALFTEVNVMLPDIVILQLKEFNRLCKRCLKVWLIVFVG